MRLLSGGIITNYRCNAACGHCLYGSSPTAEAGYMTEETAQQICTFLRANGCQSVHIGGGEPFLQTDKLAAVVRVVLKSGLALDYIETNAGWITHNAEQNRKRLQQVLDAGAECLMVSADPFHIAYVPMYKPLALIRLLREMGLPHFVWKDKYINEMRALDPERTYNRAELAEALGYDAVRACTKEYGLGFNGRALNLLPEFGEPRPMESYLTNEPCAALSDTSHFHIDYLGRYVPPRCTGMGIALADWGKPLNREDYPVMQRLLTGGIEALAAFARAQGFVPTPEGYWSRCALCVALRKHISISQTAPCRDLTPAAFYRQDY